MVSTVVHCFWVENLKLNQGLVFRKVHSKIYITLKPQFVKTEWLGLGKDGFRRFICYMLEMHALAL